MTRTPNRGEERPLHPLLERVPARSMGDILVQRLSEFLYENPRYVEVLTWIADNAGADLAPDGISVRWWGVKPLYESWHQDAIDEHVPISVWAKGSYNFGNQRGLEREWDEFWKRLNNAYPDVRELMRVFL